LENTYIFLLLGIAIGGIAGYFFLKSAHVSRAKFNDLQTDFARKDSDFSNLNLKYEEQKALLNQIETQKEQLQADYESSRNQLTEMNAEKKMMSEMLGDLKTKRELHEQTLEENRNTILQLKTKISEFTAINQALNDKLAHQKEEFEELREASTLKFEQIANKILEEKTEKFTHVNQEGLKNILTPFKENLEDLKKKVNEAYDKESKERFSLGEKVKELHELNQQISEDAKNLTQALKGETKTQGNWGEMILESILEKSGLTKGREYFLQYQLHDDQDNALLSDSEGKKMRPDALIKYPGNRQVIIDSKVSLTAFTRLLDATDDETYQREMQLHLTSIKTHINTLSAKGYDDYNKSLDFVMMFIPSEPAYIAAMQGDPNLWEYAYEKRILLLSPTNLITSLKLILDLWKREYQNENTIEIAERGAKLYDKFVGFVENLEKVGKSLDQSKDSYEKAIKQLSTGRDNLIGQAHKLKNLGLKTKKNLNLSSNDHSQISLDSDNLDPSNDD